MNVCGRSNGEAAKQVGIVDVSMRLRPPAGCRTVLRLRSRFPQAARITLTPPALRNLPCSNPPSERAVSGRAFPARRTAASG